MTTCANCGKSTRPITKSATKRVPYVKDGVESSTVLKYNRVVGIPMWCDACLAKAKRAAPPPAFDGDKGTQMSLFGGEGGLP